MAHERLTEETQLLTVDFASLSTKPFTVMITGLLPRLFPSVHNNI